MISPPSTTKVVDAARVHGSYHYVFIIMIVLQYQMKFLHHVCQLKSLKLLCKIMFTKLMFIIKRSFIGESSSVFAL